jgi:hypothetical protein
MDELDMVRELLVERRPSTAQEVSASRRRVLAATAGRRLARPARPGRAPSYRRRAAVALVGTAAAVGVVLATVPANAPPTPGGQSGADGRSGAGAGTGPGSGRAGGPAALSASQILLAAAEKAEQAPTSGARWNQRIRSGSEVMTAAGYLVDHQYSQELWVPRSASEPTWRIMQDLGARPTAPADVRAWRRDGSPSRWTIPARKLTAAEQKELDRKIAANPPGILRKARPEVVKAAGGAPYAAREDGRGSAGVIANKPRSLADLAALPTDPTRLQALLRREIAAEHIPAGAGIEPDAELFREAMHIAVHLPVSPKVRSAAFRMLAALPGVRSVGQVRDPLGRAGYAVALPMGMAGSTAEERLILDLRTGAPLAWEDIVTTAYPADPHTARVGQLSAYEAVLGAGWTDAQPKLPARRLGPEDAVG